MPPLQTHTRHRGKQTQQPLQELTLKAHTVEEGMPWSRPARGLDCATAPLAWLAALKAWAGRGQAKGRVGAAVLHNCIEEL